MLATSDSATFCATCTTLLCALTWIPHATMLALLLLIHHTLANHAGKCNTTTFTAPLYATRTGGTAGNGTTLQENGATLIFTCVTVSTTTTYSCSAGTFSTTSTNTCPPPSCTQLSTISALAAQGSTFTCNDCTQGRYHQDSQSQCSDCPIGWTSMPGSIQCQKCKAGFYGVTVTSGCLECSNGR